jgi:hypothetical protein
LPEGLLDLGRDDAAEFGRRPMRLRHSLHESSLFSDAALARLIERTPRSRFHVNTMPRQGTDPRLWREGDMAGLSGDAVLQAVARGNIWVHLQRVNESSGIHADLLDALYDGIERRVPQFRSFRQSMSILVSSPRMNVAYHADVPGQCLWQVRGQKRVWVYPAREPFLPRRTMERIALKKALDTDFAYDPSFDASAEVHDLNPGDWITWPRNCPHRVVNADCVNVSLTTEHWTDELRAGYVVDYANGLLRPLLGERELARDTDGAAFYAKFALAGAHKLVAKARRAGLPLTIDFRVDPASADGFADVTPYQIVK